MIVFDRNEQKVTRIEWERWEEEGLGGRPTGNLWKGG